MLDIAAHVPTPTNEPVLNYAPGSAERKTLKEALHTMAGEHAEIAHVVGGKEMRDGEKFAVKAPHDHKLELTER